MKAGVKKWAQHIHQTFKVTIDGLERNGSDAISMILSGHWDREMHNFWSVQANIRGKKYDDTDEAIFVIQRWKRSKLAKRRQIALEDAKKKQLEPQEEANRVKEYIAFHGLTCREMVQLLDVSEASVSTLRNANSRGKAGKAILEKAAAYFESLLQKTAEPARAKLDDTSICSRAVWKIGVHYRNCPRLEAPRYHSSAHEDCRRVFSSS